MLTSPAAWEVIALLTDGLVGWAGSSWVAMEVVLVACDGLLRLAGDDADGTVGDVRGGRPRPRPRPRVRPRAWRCRRPTENAAGITTDAASGAGAAMVGAATVWGSS